MKQIKARSKLPSLEKIKLQRHAKSMKRAKREFSNQNTRAISIRSKSAFMFAMSQISPRYIKSVKHGDYLYQMARMFSDRNERVGVTRKPLAFTSFRGPA